MPSRLPDTESFEESEPERAANSDVASRIGVAGPGDPDEREERDERERAADGASLADPDRARADANAGDRSRERSASALTHITTAFVAPAQDRRDLIEAVRHAQRGGLTDEAIAACMARVRDRLAGPTGMSGSDLFATGRARDLRIVEHWLRNDRPDRAIEHIQQFSRWRPWVLVTWWTALVVLTIAGLWLS